MGKSSMYGGPEHLLVHLAGLRLSLSHPRDRASRTLLPGSPMFLLLIACTSGPTEKTPETGPPPPLNESQLSSLSMTRLKADVDYLASDELGGRTPTSYGHGLARDYIIGQLQEAGLSPAEDNEGYTLSFPMQIEERYALDENGNVVTLNAREGTNIAAMLPGSDPERMHETIVLMAHYDHLGGGSFG